jgi:methionine sulfoxide reductase heme-binding subunit
MDSTIQRFRNHYIPVLVLSGVTSIIFSFIFTTRDTITFITQITGYISLTILAFSFVIGPVNLLLKNKNPVSTYFRRDIGTIGGALAVVHSATGLFVHLRGKPWLYFSIKSDNGYAVRLDHFGLANYTGLISALIIIFLIITSNDFMIRILNVTKWKNIQRLSYLMFILALIHCYFYRVGKTNATPLYSFYMPMFSLVLVLQMIGIWLTLNRKKI